MARRSTSPAPARSTPGAWSRRCARPASWRGFRRRGLPPHDGERRRPRARRGHPVNAVAARGPGWADALPAACPVGTAEVRAVLPAARRLVVLDDDPTGTQTVRELPVLTRWGVDDIRWALRQPTAGFFVLTNTRSLSAADAAARNREVAEACLSAGAEERVPIAFASRGDS